MALEALSIRLGILVYLKAKIVSNGNRPNAKRLPEPEHELEEQWRPA